MIARLTAVREEGKREGMNVWLKHQDLYQEGYKKGYSEGAYTTNENAFIFWKERLDKSRSAAFEEIREMLKGMDFSISQTDITIGTKKAVRDEILSSLQDLTNKQ